MMALLYKDDHNKVAYLEQGKGWEAYEQILDFLNRSHIRYALTHRPPIVFDSLVKQFWATATVRTLEAGPLEIIATIDGNEVVVTESLIRTQLQLNDANGLYEFILHDVLDGMREIRTYNFSRFILDGMIGNIGSKRHKFLLYPRFLQMILGIQTTDPSPRPTFDFTAKLFFNIKLNWDGPHMPLVEPMLVVPTGGDGADAAAANAVSPPPPPPDVPLTHTSSSTPGPSPAALDTPVRESTPVREPTPGYVRESTTFREPTPDSPRPPSPPPYPRSEDVGPTTSTRAPSPTRQTSFQEEISEGGGDYVSSPKSNEAPPTTAATAAGGTEDSAALTDLSLKLDSCINRVTTLENELGVTKKVLSGAILKLVSRQDIDLDALHKLASTSLGGDTTVKAAYTIYKASQDAHASSDAGHDEDEVPDDTTMPFKHIIPAGDGISVDAQTIPAGSTPIPSSGGVSAGGSMDPAGQAAAAAPSSTIPAPDKGKAPMVDDSLPADLLTKQERILKNLHDYQLGEDLAKKLHAEQEAEPTPTLEAPSAKRARQGVPQDVHAASSQVPASVPTAPSTAAAVSVPATPSIAADVSVFAAPFVHADTEVDADESRLDDTQITSKHVSTEHTFDESTPSSSRTCRKQIARKRVTPIVDVDDDALIKFDSASDNDDDPLPYAPYAGWEMVPTPLGSIYAYYDMEEHTKHFTYLRELLHVVEKNDLRKLLGASLADEDAHAFWYNQDSWHICSWHLYPRAQVHVLETMDGRVIYMFVDVFYPLSEATLKRMLKHGLEVPKLLIGGDLTMAEQLVSFIKAALLNAQSAV
uniref:Xylulose kinase-1 n=1 Tax=Tanacetum cinerariifolium TaxID=118510 RepID=A0A699HC00_TANCI|nr:xylulose kinase-1 [Tanacetum cinerariifolium]